MLKTNKSITITAQSDINGVQVAYMSASISTEGLSNANINKSITNQELYNANKVEVRKDMADFTALVYESEDNIIVDKEVL